MWFLSLFLFSELTGKKKTGLNVKLTNCHMFSIIKKIIIISIPIYEICN